MFLRALPFVLMMAWPGEGNAPAGGPAISDSGTNVGKVPAYNEIDASDMDTESDWKLAQYSKGGTFYAGAQVGGEHKDSFGSQCDVPANNTLRFYVDADIYEEGESVEFYDSADVALGIAGIIVDVANSGCPGPPYNSCWISVQTCTDNGQPTGTADNGICEAGELAEGTTEALIPGDQIEDSADAEMEPLEDYEIGKQLSHWSVPGSKTCRTQRIHRIMARKGFPDRMVDMLLLKSWKVPGTRAYTNSGSGQPDSHTSIAQNLVILQDDGANPGAGGIAGNGEKDGDEVDLTLSQADFFTVDHDDHNNLLDAWNGGSIGTSISLADAVDMTLFSQLSDGAFHTSCWVTSDVPPGSRCPVGKTSLSGSTGMVASVNGFILDNNRLTARTWQAWRIVGQMLSSGMTVAGDGAKEAWMWCTGANGARTFASSGALTAGLSGVFRGPSRPEGVDGNTKNGGADGWTHDICGVEANSTSVLPLRATNKLSDYENSMILLTLGIFDDIGHGVGDAIPWYWARNSAAGRDNGYTRQSGLSKEVLTHAAFLGEFNNDIRFAPGPDVEAGENFAAETAEETQLFGIAESRYDPIVSVWTETSGPGVVDFLPNANDPEAVATFSVAGETVLKLSMTDAGGRINSDEVIVTVADPVPPVVAAAGPDGAVNNGEQYGLGCSATGGIPPYTYAWVMTVGTGIATYTPGATDPLGNVSFDTDGVKTLECTATDSDAPANNDADTISVTVSTPGGGGAVTAGINVVLSKTSCIGPCTIGVNAIASTNTDSSRNTNRWGTIAGGGMDFDWDFGTASADTYDVGNSNVVKDNPRGPMAAFTYHPSSYPTDCGSGDMCAQFTITLTADDGTDTDNATQIITIYDPSNTGANGWGDSGETVCVTADATHAACPGYATNIVNETADWDTVMEREMDTNGVSQILFKVGETWGANSSLVSSDAGPGYVGTSSAGTYTVNYTGSSHMFNWNPSGWTLEDAVVTGSMSDDYVFNITGATVGMQYFSLVNWDFSALTDVRRFWEGDDRRINSGNNNDTHTGIYWMEVALPTCSVGAACMFTSGQDIHLIGSTGANSKDGQHTWRHQGGTRIMAYANEDFGPAADRKGVFSLRDRGSSALDCPTRPFCGDNLQYSYIGYNNILCGGVTGPGSCIAHGQCHDGCPPENTPDFDMLVWNNNFKPIPGETSPSNYSVCGSSSKGNVCSRRDQIGNSVLGSGDPWP